MLSTPTDLRQHFTLEFQRPAAKPKSSPQPIAPASVVAEMRTPLTSKQKQVLAFIHGFRGYHAYGPTIQEIAGNIGVVKSVASHHVHFLLRVGALRGEYVAFGTRTRLREGSLIVSAAVAATLPKENANV